ncbi:conserved hypothetical protein [Burkholderia ambifaria IOP40-10]|jgi:hypothetical protein|uniref:DUF2171 domain-containing protein n=1 Tax=Burkholderia ambifaria IOP40-10 TaxID=396596 RepID=B1FMD9_9BURK|nr:DUF2171 domain-containing protein [Burkholderia ambifaria]EDT01293.1 conserved hypothetical protein [Burkholderia ambifaria IOP40-10]
MKANLVQESMEVVGADGVLVGIVDRVEGARIKLARSAGFGKHKKHHHEIDASLVDRVQGNKAYLTIDADTLIALVEAECGSGPL